MFTVYWGGTVINAGPSPSSGNRQHPDNIPFLPPPVAWPGPMAWAGLGGQKMVQGPRCQGHYRAAAATQPAAAHNSSSADTDTVTLVILVIRVTLSTMVTMIQELLIVLMFKFMRASKHLQTELGPRIGPSCRTTTAATVQDKGPSPLLVCIPVVVCCCTVCRFPWLARARLTFAWW